MKEIIIIIISAIAIGSCVILTTPIVKKSQAHANTTLLTHPQDTASTQDTVEITKLEIDTVIYGKASWYGKGFNGKMTATGDIFYEDSLTAACPKCTGYKREYPKGYCNKFVKVTNLDNNKSVVVKITDGGPYANKTIGKKVIPLYKNGFPIPHKTRVLDLSKAAFNKIASLDKGVINIKYEILL